jgi:hypothetical protein
MLAIEKLLPAHTRGSRVYQASFSSLHMTNATISCQKRLSLALGVSFSVGGAWAFASEVKGFATEPSSSLSPRQTHSDVSITLPPQQQHHPRPYHHAAHGAPLAISVTSSRGSVEIDRYEC